MIIANSFPWKKSLTLDFGVVEIISLYLDFIYDVVLRIVVRF